MFLRKIRPPGRGKSQTYRELVESYRTAKGVRQRRIAYFGKRAGKELSGWQQLSGRRNGQTPAAPGLFDSAVPCVSTSGCEPGGMPIGRGGGIIRGFVIQGFCESAIHASFSSGSAGDSGGG